MYLGLLSFVGVAEASKNLEKIHVGVSVTHMNELTIERNIL